MYSAYQAGQLGSARPIRFSCCPCAFSKARAARESLRINAATFVSGQCCCAEFSADSGEYADKRRQVHNSLKLPNYEHAQRVRRLWWIPVCVLSSVILLQNLKPVHIDA